MLLILAGLVRLNLTCQVLLWAGFVQPARICPCCFAFGRSPKRCPSLLGCVLGLNNDLGAWLIFRRVSIRGYVDSINELITKKNIYVEIFFLDRRDY